MFSYVPHRITPDEANLQDQTAAAARAGDAGGDVDDEEDGRLDVNDARYETGALNIKTPTTCCSPIATFRVHQVKMISLTRLTS
jgi:hypothetical protein